MLKKMLKQLVRTLLRVRRFEEKSVGLERKDMGSNERARVKIKTVNQSKFMSKRAKIDTQVTQVQLGLTNESSDFEATLRGSPKIMVSQ